MGGLPTVQILIFAAFVGAVALRILTRDIDLSGLLKTQTDGTYDPERIQALLLAIAIPTVYGLQALSLIHNAPAIATLPDIPDWVIAISASSHALYLGGKLSRKAN